VCLNGNTQELKLHVVDVQAKPLLGRDWLRVFGKQKDLLSVFNVHSLYDEAFVTELIKDYDVFNGELGTLKKITGKLYLKPDVKPVFCKARSLPYAMKSKVEAELQRLQTDGIIEPVSWSDWATPIVPVLKKNGSVRLCGDFKVTVNPVLNVEQYPMPKVEDIFASLGGGKRFTKLDLKDAYLQMEMDDESRSLLTINTHKGLFRYNRLVFGIASAPALWQRAMDQVLKGLPGCFCMLDDMIITGKNEKEHLANLKAVLSRLCEYGLRLNSKKCEFFKSEVEFLGHVIDEKGLHKSSSKVNAILNCAKPENVTQLRSFLGLVNYYHKFIPNLSSLIYPLRRLLESNVKWEWSSECDKAFSDVKACMVSEQVLTHYEPDLPLKLACDASAYGLGAVLSHVWPNGEEKPIAFASRSLTKAEKNYSQIDKEALSIVWGVQKFHNYVYARFFTIETDHKPLTSIFHPKKGIPVMTAARLQRYALLLSAHNYSIQYRNTAKHCNADGLSRLPLPEVVDKDEDYADCFYCEQFQKLPVTAATIAKETRKDKTLARVLASVLSGNWVLNKDLKLFYEKRNELSVCQDCIVWGPRVVIPEVLRSALLDELHMGHLGIVKMKNIARSYAWWPNIDQGIENLVKSCDGCLQTRNKPSAVKLHPWQLAEKPWQRIHIDFAGPFLGKMFLIVVDAFSKWPEVFVMNSTTTFNTINELRVLFSRWGLPEQIVSDNGPQFKSNEFRCFLEENGIIHHTTAPYFPATNGQAERFVQTMKKALTAARGENEGILLKLSRFLLAYRNASHALYNESPAMLFLKRKLKTRLDFIQPKAEDRAKRKILKQIENAKREEPIPFEINQRVATLDHRLNTKKWIIGTIESVLGSLMYSVRINPEVVWKRHHSQIILMPEGEHQGGPRYSPADDMLLDVQFDNSNTEGTQTTNQNVSDGQSVQQRRYPLRIRRPPVRYSPENHP